MIHGTDIRPRPALWKMSKTSICFSKDIFYFFRMIIWERGQSKVDLFIGDSIKRGEQIKIKIKTWQRPFSETNAAIKNRAIPSPSLLRPTLGFIIFPTQFTSCINLSAWETYFRKLMAFMFEGTNLVRFMRNFNEEGGLLNRNCTKILDLSHAPQSVKRGRIYIYVLKIYWPLNCDGWKKI